MIARREEDSTPPAGLVDVIRRHAQRRPEELVFTALEDGEREGLRLTRGELDRRARQVAALLEREGLDGERVLLLVPQGLEFVWAFLGCLYAGAVAVPAYPPRIRRRDDRLSSIARDCAPRAALTVEAIGRRLRRRLSDYPGLAGVRWLVLEEAAAQPAERWHGVEPDPESVAFLQYTSGSTSDPKGVLVTHRSLLHNQRAIRKVFGQSEDSVVVSWLPLFHDMGLIGSVLQPLYSGSRCILMTPSAFLQKPVRWLRAISRYHATTSGGPDFAYDQCARRIGEEQRSGLDLSTWSVAFSGAEPVRARTLERFSAAFAPCGFDPRALHPCYGLAEATLLVTGDGRREGPRVTRVSADALRRGCVEPSVDENEGRPLVGCGPPCPDTTVVVVDPETARPLPEGEVGEIWVTGPSVGGGYWGRPEESCRTFAAALEAAPGGPAGRSSFLRTGDLGFLRGGELYVTARLKDLIIVRGRNHAPHDLELSAETVHGDLRPGCSAAFSIDAGEDERVVLVVELERTREAKADPAALALAVREAVASEHEIRLYEVVVARAGAVPRTSSGKVRRRACRTLYEQGELPVIARSGGVPSVGRSPALRPAGGDSVLAILHECLEATPGVEPVGSEQTLVAAGLDSLTASQLQHEIERRLGVEIPATLLLERATLTTVARAVEAELRNRDAVARDRPAEATEPDDKGHHDLSSGQEALWLHQHVAPSSSAYNLSYGYRISGPLHAAALRRTFELLSLRHPSLRCTFSTERGRPVRSVQSRPCFGFSLVDAEAWDEDRIRAFLLEELARPFDLAHGPLLRLTLIRRGDEEHLLAFGLHHIVCDFWSVAILVDEVRTLYPRVLRGEDPADALPPVRVGRTPYPEQERRFLASAEADRVLAYWRRRLADAPIEIPLPADRPRPAKPSYRGSSIWARLEPEGLRDLRAWCRRRDTTLFMALMTTFQAYLSGATGLEDVVTGTAVNLRTESGRTSDGIDYQVNPLPVRTDLSRDPSLETVLDRVRNSTIEMLAHKRYPLTKLMVHLAPEEPRWMARVPFNTMLVLQRSQVDDLAEVALFALGQPGVQMQVDALRFESLDLPMTGSEFDLDLFAAEHRGGLALTLRYSEDLFDRSTARRMLGHLLQVLRTAATAPGTRLSRLSWLSSAERAQVLHEWTESADAASAAPTPVHRRIRRQAEERSEAAAVVRGDAVLSYGELLRRSLRRASRLTALGLRPESVVAVLLPRSEELVVTLLAVLEAGMAYVPLDPNYPAERLSLMIEEGGVRLVVTDDRHARSLPPECQVRIVTLDALEAGPDCAAPPPLSRPESLAYVIFTSGSTGRPKGVAVTHGGVRWLVDWSKGAFDANELSGVLASTSICFDLSVFELLVPLALGGRVILADGPLTLPELEGRGPTLVNTVPSVAAELAATGGLPATVRTLNLAGERLAGELVASLYSRFEVLERVVNLYGPSEETVYSTVQVAPRGTTENPPIGRPLPGTRAYLLDTAGRPVPCGTPAELLLGGPGLARGYVGRPAATAERFVPAPAGGRPGGRVYRTGDRTRWLPDGRIAFLGRLDHQIKVRGFRIEPGEIEAVLLRRPEVAEAVVVSRRTGGVDRLVAYLETESAAGPPDAEALRAACARTLPGYMVPERFVALEALPRTPNGKVNRRALPEPADERPCGYDPPRTPLEEVLVEVWETTLGRSPVGVRDRFFDLGGNSLLAMRLAAKVGTALGVEVPVAALLETGTIEALAGRLRGGGYHGTVDRPSLPTSRPAAGHLLLSPAQERLWFLDRLEPGSAAYNMLLALRLLGPLDATGMVRALNRIVARHEALRTVFVAEDGEPRQRILPAVRVAVGWIDLQGLPGRERRSALRRVALGVNDRAWDLSAAPPFRCALVRSGPREHHLLVWTHHIVIDGSQRQFAQELTALYRTFAAGEPEPPPPAFQAAELAAWERRRLSGARLAERLEYWRARLASGPPNLELPADRRRPPVRSERGGSVPLELGAELHTRATACGRNHSSTLFMVLLASFHALLHRYTGSETIWVGSPVANRPLPEMERSIGCFVNTVVMAAEVAPDESFAGLLRRLRSDATEAYAHADLPFDSLVRELQPARDLSRTPLFQTMLTLVELGVERLDFPGLEVEPCTFGSHRARFDLLVALRPHAGGGLAGFAEYSADLFDPATVQRMVGHFRTLLEGAVRSPALAVEDLPLLAAAERHQLTRGWNDTARALPVAEDLRIEELFEARARATPAAVAVVADGRETTYRELDGRANALAHRLLELGVRPSEPVAIWSPRSLDLVVALLAVLKAGAAYVPLPGSYPLERRRWIVDALGVRFLVSGEGTPSGGGLGRAVAHVVPAEAGAADGIAAPPRPATGADGFAYFIFTSGSTGTPKGVMVRHRPVVNLIDWALRAFRFDASDRVLFVTSPGFDLSVFDVFGLLAAGGSIRVASEAELAEPAALVDILRAEPITFWDSAPAALQQLVPLLGGEPIPARLRIAFLSGDWIPLGLPDAVRRVFPSCSVVSLGGATEATVWSNVHPVEVVAPDWQSIPYGRPIQNARYHVLSEPLHPSPIAVPGDLYIGGGCLATGYARAPAQTAAAFVPDPFGVLPGDRLYRTGDRARFWADGTMEFLGRLDRQVKVRGYRIELGEVEAALARHAAVREAVAVVQEAPSGQRRLVAYVSADEPRPSADSLRELAASRLPDYMVPAAVVVLPELPLTAHGKVDRKALPAPSAREQDASAGEPRNPLEDTLAVLWQDLLGTEPAARGSGFFELGGDSLLVTRLVSRIREAFGVEVPVRAVFENPELGGLAAVIEMALRRGDTGGAPAIRRLSHDGEVPASYAQERLWFLDQLQPGSSAYNIAAAFRLSGPLDLPALAGAATEMARRHETLRTTFAIHGEKVVQVIAAHSAPRLPVIDLSALPEAVRHGAFSTRAEAEAMRPFHLVRGPLLRITLLRLASQEHALLVTLHHVIGDAWSMGVFSTELARIYDAFREGHHSPLPEPPVQYGDFARWQRAWLTGETLERQVAYWQERLRGAPRVLELPTDRPRPPVLSYRGDVEPIVLSRELAGRLREAGRRHGTTPFMTALAVFTVLLHRYTGQDDLLVGAPIANRNRSETEGVIGLFANSVVLRTELGDDPSFGELLGRVRESALGAYTHEDLPFEKLVDELRLERDLSHSPLFQVLFQLQAAPLRRLELAGLRLTPVDLEVRAAKLDLVLSLEETDAGLEGVWRYNTDLFDATTVRRMSRHLRFLARSLAADPERAIARGELLSPAERSQVRLEWNDTAREYAVPRLLHEGFELQAGRRADAVGLSLGDSFVTYGELDRRADALAQHLRRLGCRPESRVGVLLERSPELLVALLATLRAGGAYVPLDPEYPEERLRFMVDDAKLAAVVTDGRVTPWLGQGVSVLVPGDPAPRGGCEVEGEAEAARGAPVWSGSPAYVLYTSGSTGRPKGVVVPHGAIQNRLAWMQERLRIGPGDRVLQKTPISFDVSVWELFWPLSQGAELVLARPGGHRDNAYLAGLIQERRIQVLHFVPPMLQAFVEEPSAGSCSESLRHVVASGEALPPELVSRYYCRLETPLHNLYGPTEAAVDVTAWPCASGDGAGRTIPIGRPIANTEVLLLDAAAKPVPVGVPGELFIGGRNLARGYFGRAALTAERFVPNAWSRLAGDRLYRTGDMVRHHTDGVVEFLGRADHQVKLRGFRIELGEIESVLADSPAVHEVAVLARGDGADRALVAYVVPVSAGELPAAALRRWVAQRVPEYMVPTFYVRLERMPLTPNGKLDRKALPEPERGHTAGSSHVVAPRDDLERFLASTWADSLGIDYVGVHEDFFELGGNSIKGAVLINQLQEELGEIVHVVALFDHPTVARLAEYLRHRYVEAVSRRFGGDDPTHRPEAGPPPAPRVTEHDLADLRRLIPRPPLPATGAAPSNPRAIFVLSPPRSGSTLLRVMLAGHPGLFAPPELELLSFETLGERREALSGRHALWREGLIRAVMEIEDLDGEAATARVAAMEARDLPVPKAYAELQHRLGDRVLVDKTSTYALDLEVLRRAERIFDRPHYVHLVRHPAAVVVSFEEAKLDEIFFRPDHRFAPRQLAELVWTLSHRNILEFLAGIPEDRRTMVRFEDLVRDPRSVLEPLTRVLDVELDEEMLRPYGKQTGKMTDGVHPVSRMIGDVKFHTHGAVDPRVADRWRDVLSEDSLGEPTRALAATLGYPPDRKLSAIPRAPVDSAGPHPLAFAQERLWFLDQLQPGRATYNVPAAFRASGALSPAVLAWSLAAITQRHEPLRTTFPERDGQPVQVVTPPVPGEPRVPLVDLGSLPTSRVEPEAQHLAALVARRPFDLALSRLVRPLLVRLGSRDHLFVVVLHHLVSDGWSMGILARDLAALYAARSAGTSPRLPKLPVRYSDYARWQREWMQGEVVAGQLSYWRTELADLPVLQMPTDRPRPALATGRGDVRHLALPPDLRRDLERLARERGASLFMALLAGLQVLLARWSGQDDFGIGSPVANRSRREIENHLGLFVNTLVLRAKAPRDPRFREVVDRCRRTSVQAFRHQDLPFERLVDELNPDRDLSHSPLFQVMLVLQNASPDRIEIPGLDLKIVEVRTGSAKFDLMFTVVERSGALDVSAEYATDLFDGTTAHRLLEHLRTVLQSAVADPDRRLSEVALLGAGERHAVLLDWNDAPGRVPDSELLVHDLVEAQARRTPDALAVLGPGEHLSYGELARRVEAFAGRLQESGVEPETCVGVCLERSCDLVVALLAVLRAGGAYVPLDGNYPRRRLEFILRDADVRVVVTEERWLDALAGGGTVPDRWIVLDREGSRADGRRPATVPGHRTRGRSMAYVIYTSGSTGTPKGVAIEHRSAVAMVRWSTRVFSGAELSGVLAATSVCFDLSVFELFVPLSAGGTVILAPNVLEIPSGWAPRITLINTVPSALVELLRLGQVPPSLRTANLAGEPLAGRLTRETYARPGMERVFNLYGPSEDTTYSTAARVERGAAGEPSIGRPISGTQAYVLGPSLGLLPRGALGELCLAGRGLARGYLRRPGLTAERFVPDPFSGEAGDRLYQTGDVARHRADGAIDFLGRRDHQVKLRGFRVELGEVEAVIRRHPEVEVAAAAIRSGGPGGGRLVAYFVPREGAVLAAPDLRRHVEQHLPTFAVPAELVALEALPLTPNGKLDRSALPEPGRRDPGTPSGEGRFHSQTEEILATVWSEVLGVEAVEPNGDFFDLGGHSLLATQVVSRLRDLLQVDLPLRSFFQNPRLQSLAAEVERAIRSRAVAEDPPIVVAPLDGSPVLLSAAQEQLWFFEHLVPGTATYNMSTAFDLEGALDVSALARSFVEIARRHDVFRARFGSVDGRPVQWFDREARAPLTVGDLSCVPYHRWDRELKRLARAFVETPFDLTRGPLLRLLLLRTAPERHRLVVATHHIVCDGWSIALLTRELTALYDAFSRGRTSELPMPPVRYADFVLWQRQLLVGQQLERRLAFWRQHLEGAPALLDLPTDRPRPPVQTFRGAWEHFALPVELTAALRGAGRREGATLFMTLLAGLGVLLHRLSGQDDVVVGSGLANRRRRELEGLVGLLSNPVALRTRLAGDPPFRDVLRQVRDTTLEAHAHQDLPFETVVSELLADRDLRHSPLFQVMLMLQNVPDVEAEIGDLSLTPVALDVGTARFDLLFFVSETPRGLEWALSYNRDLFEPATIRHLTGELQRLLQALPEHLDEPISTLAVGSALGQELIGAFSDELESEL